MSQQINLINESLRRRKDYVSAVAMVRAVGGVLLLLCAVSGFLFQQTHKLDAERADWARRAEDAKTGMMQRSQQLPQRQASTMLQTEIKKAEEKIQSRDRVFDVLNSGAVGKSQGFSALLEAFARQQLDGVWLIGISMNGAGDQARISGNALSADLIPQFISRLSTEQALHGRNFSALQIGQPKPAAQPGAAPVAGAPSYVEFVLSADKVAEKPLEAAMKTPAEAKR